MSTTDPIYLDNNGLPTDGSDGFINPEDSESTTPVSESEIVVANNVNDTPASSFSTYKLPIAKNDTYTDNENTTLTVPVATGVLANDTDPNGNTLQAAVVSNPSHGTIAFNSDGSFAYTPTTGYYGTDSFTYKETDSAGLTSNKATVTIKVIAPPIATNDNYTDTENGTLTVTAANGVLKKIQIPIVPPFHLQLA